MAGVFVPSLKLIPKSIDSKDTKTIQALNGIEDILLETQKKELQEQKRKIKIDKEYTERDKYIRRLLENSALGERQAKFLRIQNKLTMYYEKYLMKNKFFQTALKGIQSFVKAAGDNFFKSLLGLLAIAFMGPEMLNSLIDMFVNIAIAFIDILIKLAPVLFNAIIRVLFDVLPPAIVRLINSLFPAIGKRLDMLWKGTKLEGLGKALFGMNGIITKLFRTIGPFIPILFVGVGLIAKLIPLFSGLFTIVSALGGPLTLIIIAFTLMFVYSEELGSLLEKIPNWLRKNLGPIGYILAGVFEVIMTPAKILLTLFTNLKKLGPAGLMNMIWKKFKFIIDSIVNWFKNLIFVIPNALASFVKSIPQALFSMVAKMMPSGEALYAWGKKFFKYLNKLLDFFGDVFNAIKLGGLDILGDTSGVVKRAENIRIMKAHKTVAEVQAIERQAGVQNLTGKKYEEKLYEWLKRHETVDYSNKAQNINQLLDRFRTDEDSDSSSEEKKKK